MSGETKPGFGWGVSFRAGVKNLEKVADELSEGNPTLRRPMALTTRRLKLLTVQQARKSPSAADDAIEQLTLARNRVKDEYDDLARNPEVARAVTEPYLKFVKEADELLRQLSQARARGAAVGAEKLREAPAAALSEASGLTKRLFEDRTARGSVWSLVRAKTPHELVEMAEPMLPGGLVFQPARPVGGLLGAMSPAYRKRKRASLLDAMAGGGAE
jgi:hypothetical protein